MARVVSSKTLKTASLNLSSMADKGRIDINQDDINTLLKDITINGSQSPSYTWDRESKKPYVLEGVIEQIKSIFNVGKEVESWSVNYYAPPQKNEKGKPIEDELRIPPPAEKGLGGRFIIIYGSKEVPTLEVAVGSSGAKNKYLMMDGDCIYLKITICPVLNVVFSNRFSEKMAPRSGFREMIIKKNLFNRHILVVDAHVSISAIAEKVKKELIGVASEETIERMFTKSDQVAEMAKKKTTIVEEKTTQVEEKTTQVEEKTTQVEEKTTQVEEKTTIIEEKI
jgi:hypothetical protein